MAKRKRKGAKKPSEMAFEWIKNGDGRQTLWLGGEFGLYVLENSDGSWVSHLSWCGSKQIDVAIVDTESAAKDKAIQMLAEKLASWQAQLNKARTGLYRNSI